MIAGTFSRDRSVPISDGARKVIRHLLSTHPTRVSLHHPRRERNKAINELTVGEALYFSSATTDSDVLRIRESLNSLLAVWHSTWKEIGGTGQDTLLRTWDEIDELSLSEKWNWPARQFVADLAYQPPFLMNVDNGLPITVDLHFEDETIIEHFRSWLNEERRRTGERARRPFRQDDFDDWEHYKIRELFDLETWARLKGVRIPDNVLANALWPTPPQDISPLDVLRTTTRKKVGQVFSEIAADRFYRQLYLERGEQFIKDLSHTNVKNLLSFPET